MKITKNKIFYGILGFLILVNLLVIFDLNQFYIRAILSFLFITIVPGLLIMLMVKIREVKFWEYLVYSVGLSVSFIMFAGLAINWILPWLNITDKPLATFPILISFNILLIVFWLIAKHRNKDLQPLKTQPPKFDTLNAIMFTIPVLFPIFAILGAFLLNNHGTNTLTMIMLGGIAIYVLMIVVLRNKLNPNIYPWALWMMGLGLLLMFSMRSWFISGWDILQENLVFQLTEKNSYWSMSYFKDAYNACLSITILPVVFYRFLDIKADYIFKLLFPIIFGLVPVVIFLTSKKYTKLIIAFLAAFSFILIEGFIKMSVLARQEIAFLFFSLIIFVIFNKKIKGESKKILFILFFLSIIISHYSTSYLAIFLIIFIYLFTPIFKKISKKKIPNNKNNIPKTHYYLTTVLVTVIILSSFLWHSQITDASSGLIGTLENSIKNIPRILDSELKEEGASFSSQFNPFRKSIDYSFLLTNYTEETRQKYLKSPGLYKIDKYNNYISRVIYPEVIPLKISSKQASNIYLFQSFLIIIIKIFIFIGVINILLLYIKKRKIDSEYLLLCLGSIFLIGIMIILPMLTINYSIGRLYQQVLIILALPLIIGGLFSLRFIKKNLNLITLSIILIILFLFVSGFIPQLIGGKTLVTHLDNAGTEYYQSYSHNTDLKSTNWILHNYNKNNNIHADRYSRKRFSSFSQYLKINEDIIPQAMSRDSYVYLGYANKAKKIIFKTYSGRYFILNLPTQFLHKNKNKIYNNGGSEIFK